MIIPIFGNHDSQPANEFSPPDFVTDDLTISATQSMYAHVATTWAGYVDDPSVVTTIKEGGYYKISPEPGLVIIVLNTNYCLSLNFWILYNPRLMYDQLVWFENELNKAERIGATVHVLSHVPSNEISFDITCARELRRILDRYHKIIAFIANGHVHRNDLNFFYSLANPKCLNVLGVNGGSVTSWSDGLLIYPNFNILNVDPKTKVTQILYFILFSVGT